LGKYNKFLTGGGGLYGTPEYYKDYVSEIDHMDKMIRNTDRINIHRNPFI